MKKILRPYLFISFCGLIAFAPISFMLRALKNDIVALEYPINHFISHSLRNGELPYWFNTWGMGFPLQSNLTWGIYSTPQLLFSSAFNYNIYSLHIEFLFFILLSGWSMFHLLRTYLVKEERISQVLAICYMLSGFMVGSTQWLLYITAAAFVPLVLSSLLKLLQGPSFKNSVQVAVCYTLMFTSVYAAFNIITTYTIVGFVFYWLVSRKKGKDQFWLRLRYLFITALLTALLCFPCLYFTLEVLGNLDRGTSITGDVSFFNSNYLHPGALSSMLFPFSSVRMGYANTEGTMLDSYAGLFVLAVLPLSLFAAIKEKNKTAWILLSAALFFLLLSFGHLSPLRKWINFLPGFSYFRNPAIFRFYFILSLLLFTAVILQKRKWEDILSVKTFRYALVLLAIACVLVILLHTGSLANLSFTGWKNANYTTTLLVSSLVQLVLISLLLFLIHRKKWRMALWVFAGDLVINTLLCTPFFSVSNYSLPEVDAILHSRNGFPVQQRNVGDVQATFTDHKGNTWQNINVFTREVSANESYRGPLVLNNLLPDSNRLHKPLVYSSDSSAVINVEIQRPTHVRARVRMNRPGAVTLQQNNYPGWKVFVNDEEKRIRESTNAFITVDLPAGESRLVFRYERKPVWLSALFVHLAVLIFGLVKLREVIRSTRSASPS